MYEWLKVFHVIAVVLFLGNIITGVYWHKHALRTGDPRAIAIAMRGVIGSDRLFTMPGVFAIIATGVGMALVTGWPIFGTPWILWSIVLFGVSGAVFMARLAPLQRRMAGFAEAAADSGNFDRAAYEAMSRQWDFWGAVATIAPLGALALMVLKPAF
jgi:uncharacterized membrane protein